MSKHRVTVEIPPTFDPLVVLRIGEAAPDLPERLASLRDHLGGSFHSFCIDVCGRLVVLVHREPNRADIAEAVANGRARVV